MRNPYINTHDEYEQYVIEDLINEAVDIHSTLFYYIPRTLVSPDNILNEDRLSEFKNAYPFSGYLETAQEGLEGQYFMQKFGGIFDYSATVTITRREWRDNLGQLGATNIPDRPNEGDLLYYPVTDSLFEIKFVDDKSPFAQLDKFYTYKLTIEQFQYSSEHIETGNAEIDVFESLKSFDVNPDRSLWGRIIAIDLVDKGKGYTQCPEILIDSFTGSGAQFNIELDESDGSIKSIEVIDGGSQYHSTDTMTIKGDCDHPAYGDVVIRNTADSPDDQWGANNTFKEQSEDKVFDADNYFGIDDQVL